MCATVWACVEIENKVMMIIPGEESEDALTFSQALGLRLSCSMCQGRGVGVRV